LAPRLIPGGHARQGHASDERNHRQCEDDGRDRAGDCNGGQNEHRREDAGGARRNEAAEVAVERLDPFDHGAHRLAGRRAIAGRPRQRHAHDIATGDALYVSRCTSCNLKGGDGQEASC